jgi:hypothetical protein
MSLNLNTLLNLQEFVTKELRQNPQNSLRGLNKTLAMINVILPYVQEGIQGEQQVQNASSLNTTKFQHEVKNDDDEQNVQPQHGLENIQSGDNMETIGTTSKSQHLLEKTSKRRRCVECYNEVKLKFGRITAYSRTPRTKQRCSICEKFYCTKCFSKVHNSNKR